MNQIRIVTLALLVSASCLSLGSATSFATVFISSTNSATVGLSGYTTTTLTATTNDGSQIVGFDFASIPTYGIFGTLNQLNPFGLTTIFADNNAVITALGGDVSQDTQFEFTTSNLTIPSGFSSESATQLRSVFAFSSPVGTSVPFAQVVTGSGGHYQLTGQVTTLLNGIYADNNVTAATCLCGIEISPKMFTNVDANNPGLLTHTFLTSVDLPDITNRTLTWSNFALDYYFPGTNAGPLTGPANPAAFNPTTQTFSWDTHGSQVGLYEWSVTASAQGYTAQGIIEVQITKVPEPNCTALGILGLCAFWLGKRKNSF